MPWFPEFANAMELARLQIRATGLADPVGQYLKALNQGDTHALETVWPGEVVIYDPRAEPMEALISAEKPPPAKISRRQPR